jgi:hypothetical protein
MIISYRYSISPSPTPDDDDVYLEYYSGKGFHINYFVYMSYAKHINSSNKAEVMNT